MCGISIHKNFHQDELTKHRGIQTTSLTLNGMKYAHHRLPIQTLVDDEWNQPVHIKDGWYLMFNGEIFNYDTEKYDNDVEYLQDYFRTTMNMEDIIEEMNKWDGFWSMVLSNGEEIIAFTDPLGKKQLYYNVDTHEIM